MKVSVKKIIPYIILTIVFLLIYNYIFDKKLNLGGDNFDYINLAQSIKDGHGYSYPYYPDHQPANWFPPGYSYLLAGVMFINNDVIAFKILNGLLFLFLVLLFFYTFRELTGSDLLTLFISIFILFNVGLLGLSTIIMSEIPYMFFCMLVIYFLIKKKSLWGIIIFSAAVLYLRSTGIALIGAIVLYLVSQKRFKDSLIYTFGTFILYVPYIIRNKILDLKGRYLETVMSVNPWKPETGNINTIGEFLDKVKINFIDTVLNGFPDVMLPFNSEHSIVLGLFFLIIIGFGLWKLKNYRWFFVAYLVLNIGVLLIWHPGNGVRYVWPLVPVLYFIFFYAIYVVINMIIKNSKVVYLFYVLILFSFSGLENLHTLAKQDYNLAYKNYFQIAKEVKKLNKKDLMVICRKPGMFHYYSGTYVDNYLFSTDPKEVIDDLTYKNADFVVLEHLGYGSTGRYLFPAINTYQQKFNIVLHLKNPDTYLLKYNN